MNAQTMNLRSHHTQPAPPREHAALVTLLDDDDPNIFAAVQKRILSLGPESCEWLRPHTLSSNPLVRRRTLGLIHHFTRRETDREFIFFCLTHGENLDLETGALLLARTTFPDLNAGACSAVLDEFAGTLRHRLKPGDSPREVLARMNQHLFTELGFCGNEESYFDPGNSYLNRVLERRTGNPISLCLVYMLVAARLQLPITGIGLPGHFVCRHQSNAGSIYIDAFDRGRLLTKTDCVQYLIHSAFGLDDQFLAPVPPRRMLIRMCGNLHQIYLHLEQQDEATRMQGYIVALSGQKA